MTMYYQPIPEDTVPEITETGKKYGSIDELLAETRPMIGENNEGSGYAPVYSSPVRGTGLYAGFYERSDLTNFILAIDMPITPFGDVGFYGVTSNMAFAQRNETTTRGDRTQQLLTDSHEIVFHVIRKMTDNNAIGFYHIRRMQAAMFPRKSEQPLDRYAREAIYRN